MNVGTANRSSRASDEIRRNAWTCDTALGALRVPGQRAPGSPPQRQSAKGIGNLRSAPGTEALGRIRAREASP
jgi:hypothetical protein